MDPEGSDIDELADIDLSTFAPSSVELSEDGLKTNSKKPKEGAFEISADGWYGENEEAFSGGAVLPETRIIYDDDLEGDQSPFDSPRSMESDLNSSQGGSSTEGLNSSNPFYAELIAQARHTTISPTNPFAADIAVTNPFSPVHTNTPEKNVNSDILLDEVLYPKTSDVDDSNPFRGSGTVHRGVSQTEYVYLNRLPGENLGMVLGIEGDQENRRPVDAVIVKSITLGGAAARACEGSNQILVGDEIREVDGKPLTELTHDACVALFADIPENVILTILRKPIEATEDGVSNSESSPSKVADDSPSSGAKRKRAPPVPPPRKCFKDGSPSKTSSNLVDPVGEPVPKGFVKLDVTIFREEGDSLGLSIVPSYGATCNLYQVKRLLPDGACALSQRLEIGDRLLSCNGLSLRGLTQAQCLHILKTSGHVTELSILRHIDGEHQPPTETGVEGDKPLTSPLLTSAQDKDTGPFTATTPPVSQSQDQRIPQQTTEKEWLGSERDEAISNDTIPALSDPQLLSAVSLSIDENVSDLLGSDPYPESLIDNTSVALNESASIEESSSRKGNEDQKCSHIPPPSAFADSGPTLLDSADPVSSVSDSYVTNLDDLLGLGIESNSSDQCVLNPTAQVTNSGDNLLVEFEEASTDFTSGSHNPEHTFSEEEFSGRSIEEFAEQCFNSIFTDSEQNISQTPVNGNAISEINVQAIPEPHVTVVPISPTAADNQHITSIQVTAPVQPITQTATVSSPVRRPRTRGEQDKLYGSTHVTVNPGSISNVTSISVDTKKGDVIKLQTAPGGSSSREGSLIFSTDDIVKKPNSALIQLDNREVNRINMEVEQGDRASVEPVVNGDSEIAATASPSSGVPNALVHTTLGVHTNGKSGEEEEIIQPMVAVKDSQGKQLVVPSSDDKKQPATPERIFNDTEKNYLVNILASINTPVKPTNDAAPAPVKKLQDSDGIVEPEVVPTVLSREQKAMATNVLIAFGNVENIASPMQPQKPSVFQKAVSEVIQTIPSTAWVLTTVGVNSNSQSGDDEEVIQPAIVAKDSQGKAFCVPASAEEQKKPSEAKGGNKFDDIAKQELASVMAAFNTPKPTTPPKSTNIADINICEEPIVPTLLTRDQKKVALDVLQLWGDSGADKPPPLPKNKPSLFQAAVSNVINTLPKDAVVHTTLGVTTNKQSGEEEDIIQPMFVAKDALGKPHCVPSSLTERKPAPKAKVFDENAKEELTKVLGAFASSSVKPISAAAPKPVKDLGADDGHTETEIVPTILTRDQKELVLGMLSKWGSQADKKKPSALQSFVSNLIQTNKKEEKKDPSTGIPVEETILDFKNQEVSETVPKNYSVEITNVDKSFIAPFVQSNETNGDVAVTENVIAPEKEEPAKVEEPMVQTSPVSKSETVPIKDKVFNAVGMFEKVANDLVQSPYSDAPVVFRPKSKQSSDFKAKIDSFQAPTISPSEPTVSTSSSARVRPKSMVEATSGISTFRVDDLRKSFTTENTPSSSHRPLSAAVKPLSLSTARLDRDANRLSAVSMSRTSSAGPFSSSTFSHKAATKPEYPKTRQENGSPFQVDVLKGIVGLGIKIGVTTEGQAKITEVQKNGPVDKNGNIRVGDYLLSVNSTELSGQTDARVQQVLRLLPRGLVKLVVASTPPSTLSSSGQPSPSGEKPQTGNAEGSTGHYGLRLSPKPFGSDSRPRTPSSEPLHIVSPSSHSVDNADKKKEQEEVTLPIFTAAEPTPTSSQPPLMARIEITPGSQNGEVPMKIAIKPTPAARPSHEIVRPKALPRSSVNSYVAESWDTSSEGSTPKELLKSGSSVQSIHSPDSSLGDSGKKSPYEQKRSMFEKPAVAAKTASPLVAAKPTPLPKPSSGKTEASKAPESPVPLNESAHDSQPEPDKHSVEVEVKAKAETETPVEAIQATSIQSPTPQMVPSPVASPTSQKVSSPEASPTSQMVPSPVASPTSQKVSSPEASPTSQMVPSPVASPTSQKVSSPVTSPTPQKVPPPVAPKPRLSSTSSNKSEDNNSEVTLAAVEKKPTFVKNTPKSAGYERLQAIQKSAKPSKIIEKSRTFVTSTAKKFDKTPDTEQPPPKEPAPQRKISVGFTASNEGSRHINSSLVPLSERRKSTGSSMGSSPFSLSKPTSIGSAQSAWTSKIASRPRDLVIPESPRDGPTGDEIKSTNVTSPTRSVMSPTRLNAALSPRRASSSESPTSPPLVISPPHAPRVRDDKRTKSFDGKIEPSHEHSGIFKVTSVTVHETSPPSQKQDPSSHKSSQLKTRSYSVPGPAPILSRTSSNGSQLSEEVLEDTMKKFDDLLMDAPYVRSETDPIDILLWTPVRKDNSPSKATSPKPKSPDTGIKSKSVEDTKPVAPPRRKPVTPDASTPDSVENTLSKEDVSQSSSEAPAQVSITSTVQTEPATDVVVTPVTVTTEKEVGLVEGEAENTEDQQDDASDNLSEQVTDTVNVNELESAQSKESTEEITVSAEQFEQNSGSVSSVRLDLPKPMQTLIASESKTEEAVKVSEAALLMKPTAQQQPESEPGTEQEVTEIEPDAEELESQDLEPEFKKTEEVKPEAPLTAKDEVGAKSPDVFEEQASKIVDDVMAQVTNNPSLFKTEGGQDSSEQRAESESSDDEPPPLPGAPPPPLILRDPTLLVADRSWLETSEAEEKSEQIQEVSETINVTSTEPIHTEPFSQSIKEESSSQDKSIFSLEVNNFEESSSHTDSIEPLNSTGDSAREEYGHKRSSPSPVDILSEDSGMQADEDFQEVATDEAISPPGEFADIDTVSLQVTPIEESASAISPEPQMATVDVEDFKTEVDNSQTEQKSPSPSPPVLPSTAPPSLHANMPVTKDNIVSVDISVSSPLQATDSQPSLQETTSHGDEPVSEDIKESSNKTLVESNQSVVSTSAVENADSKAVDETPVKSPRTVSKVLEDDISVSDSASQYTSEPSPITDSSFSLDSPLPVGPVTISSPRQFTLRSNTVGGVMLEGKPSESMELNFPQGLIGSVLTAKDFKALLDKTNTTLDSLPGAKNVEILVVHLYREGESASLGVDLKQSPRTAWCKITSIRPGTPVALEGSISVGDDLVAIDNLWCTEVTSVMRLLGRLTKPKHDSIMVVARGRESESETKDAPRPVPVPRPRLSTSGVDKPVAEPSVVNGTGSVTPAPELPSTAPPPIPSTSPVEDVLVQQSAPPSVPVSVPPPSESTTAPPAPTTASLPKQEDSTAKPKAAAPQVTATATAATPDSGSEVKQSANGSVAGPGIHKVIMLKGATGVGFCLEGGYGSPKGNLPIAIKRIFKGGPAEKCGQLKVKDEILEVNGIDFSGMRHYEAWNHLKFLDDGEVLLTIRRH